MSNFGVPTDEQLSKINKLAKRTLSKDEVFVFPSKLAGDMIIPNRYIQLQKQLLDVYAADAKKGVSLLLDHSWSPDGFWGLGGRPKAAIPYGRTFDSRYESSTEEGETISLVADHYMVKGVEIDGIKTDDLATSIEAGTLFDTSIGFGFDKATCSVCGENYRSNKCSHYAGKTYEVEENGVTKNKLCFIKAEPPGYLMENSLVFDGAYPGAGVLSNVGDVGENENGVFEVVSDLKNIDPDKRILSIYSNHRGLTTLVKKSDHKKIFATGGIVNPEIIISGINAITTNTGQSICNSLKTILEGSESPMDKKVLEMLMAIGFTKEEAESLNSGETTKVFSKIAEKLEIWKGTFGTLKIAEGVEELEIYMTQDQVTEKLCTELSADEVLKLAKEGQEYRKSLSDEAIAMGVRAMGNDFPKETWENSFTNMDTKAIKDIMATWELQANASIPAGRQTDPAAGQEQKLSIPDAAFKVGK
jgi:hypothetical protein